MAKKITKNYMPEIPQYSFGGWVGENAGAIGTGLGVGLGALGSVLLPGVGTIAGASLGASIGSALGGAAGGIAQSNYQAGQTKIEQDRLKNEEMKAMRPVLSGLSPKSMYGIYAKGGGIGGEDNAIINIEKGELAIKRPEPNSRLGKIVQEFTGKNPFTGTDFLPHASKKTKEPIGNYVPTEMVKDELKADYIISKKYAQQYKDATKRKDKYTLNSILRNIDAESEMGKDPRNTQMKKGGAIPKYAVGGGFDLRSQVQGFPEPYSPLTGVMYNSLSDIAPYTPQAYQGSPDLRGGRTGFPSPYSPLTGNKRNLMTDMAPLVPQTYQGSPDLRGERVGFTDTWNSNPSNPLANSPLVSNQNKTTPNPFERYEIPKAMPSMQSLPISAPTSPQFGELKGSSVVPNTGTSKYPGGNSPVLEQQAGMNSLTKNALLASVPGAINLARGLFEKPVKQQMVSPLFNPYEGQALSKLSGRVSSQPAISELNNQRNSYMQGLKGSTSNQSVYRSNLQNLFGNSGKTAGNIVNQTRQTNLGLDAQQSQAMMNAGAQRVNAMDQARGTNLQLSQMNQQAQAAKDNMLYQGLSDIPKQQLQLNQNRDAQRMEAFKMMMLMDTFGTAQDMYNQPKYASYFNQLGIKR